MKKREYMEFYEKISAPFRRNRAAFLILRSLNIICTGIMYILYPVLLFVLFRNHDERLLKCFLIPAVSFVCVSVARTMLNTPRPYTAYPIRPLLEKDKEGCSMPSRHIFSSAVIAMAYLKVYPAAGILLMGITVIEAVIRVIAGVHYPKDVLAGCLIGILAGLLI